LLTLTSAEASGIAMQAIARADYQLLITAARALGDAADKERAVAALFAALDRITAQKRDTSRDPRLAILSAVERLEVQRTEALRPYLSDFDPAVATRAAEIVQKWTGRPEAATPRPLPIPAVKLADLEGLHHSRLRFVIAGRGAFELGLLAAEAPLSVRRVVTRAREGYYNGLTFHRVVPNFVIQGGSPGANEYVGDGPYMRDEVGLRSHRRGSVGISTRGRDTGDAQIFVDLVDLPQLDHNYTVFAEVVAGMDVVDQVLEGDVIERVDVVAAPDSSPHR
jgi:cyclophilin family peptidyl-prolyl cis-trans isomerase